ncbi:MAG: hydroxyacid dehydrogenase [Proteobacteria bacterium]|nr:hydroxyacid dehydrogenase [Pseudomonadota bacterium]
MTDKKPRVYYTHKIPSEAIKLLKLFCEVIEHNNFESPTKKEIIRNSRNADVLCCFVPDCIDEEIIASCPQLRIIASCAAGHDGINVPAATMRGIWVTIVNAETIEPTADLTWALLLSSARGIVPADFFVRSGDLKGWCQPPPFSGQNIFGKTLGIIGMGSLGRAIARRAVGFNMTSIYYQRHRLEVKYEQDLKIENVVLEELFKTSDFICIATPLTDETFHFISDKEFALMKPTAIIINTARGSVVDEEAVAKALKEKKIAGYAADVFEMEDTHIVPRPFDVNQGLIDQKSCTVLTPHLGTAVMETRLEIFKRQALCVLQVLKGEKPNGAVNDVPLKPAITG